MEFNVYSQQGELIGSASGQGSIRIDANVSAGEQVSIEVINNSQAQSIDLTVANLVSLENGVLTVHGTNLDDAITIDSSDQINATVNGLEFQYSNSSVDQIVVRGHNGSDSIDLTLGDENDQVSLLTDTVHARNSNLVLVATGFDQSSVVSGGGFDQLYFVDSTGNDQISAGQNANGLAFVSLNRSTGESRQAVGFDQNYIRSLNGTDALAATGSQESDLFGAYQDRSYLNLSDQATFVFDSFNSVTVDGNGGDDLANLVGTDGKDEFLLGPNTGVRNNDQGSVSVNDFSRINAVATDLDQQKQTGNYDSLNLVDSIGNDSLYQNNQDVVLSGEGYHLYGQGFTNVQVESVGGIDQARIFDTAGNDTFKSTIAQVSLRAQDLLVSASGFEDVSFTSTAGNDRATIIGSAGDDLLKAGVDDISFTTEAGNQLNLSGVARTFADLGPGDDRAELTGGAGDDQFEVGDENADFNSLMQFLRVRDFQNVSFDGNGGNDNVKISGTVDLLAALGDQATVVLENHRVQLADFSALDVDSIDDAIVDLDYDLLDFNTNLNGN